MTHQDERLDAWYDGSAICLIAMGALIAKLQHCLAESEAAATDD